MYGIILLGVFNENKDFAICKCKFNKTKPTLGWNKFVQKHLGDMKRIQAETEIYCWPTEHHVMFLTAVCTIRGLWVRKRRTVWNMSIVPSNLTRSRAILMAQNVPVRPLPSLEKRMRGREKLPENREQIHLRKVLNWVTRNCFNIVLLYFNKF